MLICIPTEDQTGLDARVCGHFGSAPCFTLVDSEGGEPRIMINRNAHHAHGTCHPLSQLQGLGIDAVVGGGMGHRALAGLKAAGLTVYRAPLGCTAAAVLTALREGTLAVLEEVHACGGHGHGSGAAHGHNLGRGTGLGHRHGRGGHGR